MLVEKKAKFPCILTINRVYLMLTPAEQGQEDSAVLAEAVPLALGQSIRQQEHQEKSYPSRWPDEPHQLLQLWQWFAKILHIKPCNLLVLEPLGVHSLRQREVQRSFSMQRCFWCWCLSASDKREVLSPDKVRFANKSEKALLPRRTSRRVADVEHTVK